MENESDDSEHLKITEDAGSGQVEVGAAEVPVSGGLFISSSILISQAGGFNVLFYFRAGAFFVPDGQ